MKKIVVLSLLLNSCGHSVEYRSSRPHRPVGATQQPGGDPAQNSDQTGQKSDSAEQSGSTTTDQPTTASQVPAPAPTSTPKPNNSPMKFSIIISQTVQDRHDWFLWFYRKEKEPGTDELKQSLRPKLSIEYSLNGKNEKIDFQHGLNGMENAFGYHIKGYRQQYKHSMFIKKDTGDHGIFWADLATVPANATINKATLHLTLEDYEGVAGGDRTSKFVVREYKKSWKWGDSLRYNDGDIGETIREISTGGDVTGKGHFEWSNFIVPFDFTEYIKKLQSKR